VTQTSTPSTKDVALYFARNVNWDFFYSAVDTLGDSLNSPKNRFDKSDILELAIDIFSDGAIRHTNLTGRDFFIPAFGLHCEMKYETDLLFTPRGKVRRFISLTLVNTMGSNDRRSLPEDYSPFLLAVGSLGAAVVSRTTLETYLDTDSDSGQIKAKNIPNSEFEFVITPTQQLKRRVVANFDYSAAKLDLQKKFLNRFKSTLEG